MRVLVCGGRDFKEIEAGGVRVCEILSQLPNSPEKSEVEFLTGMARGADQIPVYLYKNQEGEWGGIHKFYPDWNKYGKSAGFYRNTAMLVEGRPDLVIAFTGGKGTKMMVDIARKAGVEVIEVDG